ncbi:MAG: carboxypeptidase regulatory-like domain-containing protein [Candidatus Acidiferrales bacterium]
MNRKLISWTAAAAFALVVVGCSKNQSQTTGEEQPAGASAAKKTVDMSTVGSVSGVVKLDGTAPKFKPINMSADPYCVKANKNPVYPDQVVTGPGNSLANVVVYVKTGAEDYSFPTPSESVTLDQKDCMYTPHIVALMVGQELKVVNSDDTTHNIHPTPADNREWNKSQPPHAAAITDTFARPEVAIPVKCNVHPWMKGYIAVMANPYYAVTDKDGKFELKNLPPGTYTIEAWQEKYGVVDQTVTIGAKESKTSDFTFKASSGS